MTGPSIPLAATTDPLDAPFDPLETSTDPLEAPTDPLEAPTDLQEAPTDPMEAPNITLRHIMPHYSPITGPLEASTDRLRPTRGPYLVTH